MHKLEITLGLHSHLFVRCSFDFLLDLFQRLRQEEELRNQEWDRQRVAMARAGELLERQQERVKKEMNKQQANDNRRLGQEQKSHKDFLYNEVYTNPPSAAYFMQFNTTSR